MRPHGAGRHCAALSLLCVSALLALIAAIAIVACIFSVSFRYVHNDETRGTKFYGLFRFCYEPNEEPPFVGGIEWPHNDYSCHLRRRAPANAPLDYRQYYTEFELCTLILLSLAALCALIGLSFAICTLYSPLCAAAHSLMLLISAISAIAAFVVYTYYNELKDNQMESTNGVLYMYRYGWAYFYTGASSIVLLASFIVSLAAAALFLRNRNLDEEKRTSMYL